MVMTPSNMLPIGTEAPDFTLYDTVSQEQKSLDDMKSDKATVIMFICNHCPFVKYIETKLAEVAQEYQTKGIAFIGISSNDADNYPEDAPDKMAAKAEEVGYTFPYLYDETQDVARAYQAACTPDFYIFDGGLKCVYRGQFDDSRPSGDTPVTAKDISTALDNILHGKPVDPEQKPSLGCNIKWKS